MGLASVNHLAVLAAAAASWLFGALYYGLLGNAWLAAQGKTKESMRLENAGRSKAALAAPFVLSFVAELIMGWVLFGIMTHIGAFTVPAGLIAGAFCWFGFVLTTIVVNNGYSGRRPLLTVIDATHWLGVLLILGAILGWFGA